MRFFLVDEPSTGDLAVYRSATHHELDHPGPLMKHGLDEATSEAEQAGLAVAPGRATEIDRAVPFTTLLSALRQAQLVGLETSRLGDGELQFRKIDQVGEAIEEYVQVRPLLIAVDDAHWADEMSALALRVLVPALTASPVLWLLSRSSGITSASEDLRWARAMLQEARGQSAAALGTLTELYDRLPQRLLLFTTDPGAAPVLVRDRKSTRLN